MYLNPGVFRIRNIEKIVQRTENFIEEAMTRLHRDGIVIGISGGLDSSVTAALAARAVGADKVTGLMLHDREETPEAKNYAETIAKHLDIHVNRFDISPILSKLQVYRFFSKFFPSRKKSRPILLDMFKSIDENPFIEFHKGMQNHAIRKGISLINCKHRVRLIYAYQFAEEHNLLVVGAAQKTEDLLGLYTKFGIDDCADIMPLRRFYRTQVLHIGQYLNLPEKILTRPSNPDILPELKNKYKDILGFNVNTLDLILYGLKNNMKHSEMAKQLSIEENYIKKIAELVDITEHMRKHSMPPSLL